MIEFNKNNKAENINFQAKKINKEKIMEPVKDFLKKGLQRAEFEVTDVGAFKEIEMLNENSNQYQDVAKFGFRIRPASPDHNSKQRVLELVATKKSPNEQKTMSQGYLTGTREEILARLKDPEMLDDLQKYVDEANTKFFNED